MTRSTARSTRPKAGSTESAWPMAGSTRFMCPRLDSWLATPLRHHHHHATVPWERKGSKVRLGEGARMHAASPHALCRQGGRTLLGPTCSVQRGRALHCQGPTCVWPPPPRARVPSPPPGARAAFTTRSLPPLPHDPCCLPRTLGRGEERGGGVVEGRAEGTTTQNLYRGLFSGPQRWVD